MFNSRPVFILKISDSSRVIFGRLRSTSGLGLWSKTGARAVTSSHRLLIYCSGVMSLSFIIMRVSIFVSSPNNRNLSELLYTGSRLCTDFLSLCGFQFSYRCELIFGKYEKNSKGHDSIFTIVRLRFQCSCCRRFPTCAFYLPLFTSRLTMSRKTKEGRDDGIQISSHYIQCC